MTVVMVIAGVAVLAVIVGVAMGHGGGLPAERGDYAPLDLGPVSATDVALLRLPTAMWGYSMQATDEALERIAESVRERDVRIVALEQLVTDLSRDPAPQPLGLPYAAARHRRAQPDAGTGAVTASEAGAVSPAAQPASPQPAEAQSAKAQSAKAQSAEAGPPGGDGLVPLEQSHD